MALRQTVITALMLTLFAMLGTALVAVTHTGTRARIAENERAALLRSLQVLIPPDAYDNDIFADTISVHDPALLGTTGEVTVFRARKDGKPVAAVMNPVAPDGYGGEIRLLIGIYADGTLAGVRVVSHHETPGLGDAIEASRSDWITRFAGHSLHDPQPAGWNVKRDSGVFDQFTGATITPRAVVRAIYRALVYFQENRERLFAEPSQPASAG